MPQFTPQQRVQRFRQYYQRKNDRPLLGFFVGDEYPLRRYPSFACLPQDRPLQPEDISVEALVADTEELYRAHEACGGDFLFAATAFWGVPWLEAALGCFIYANHATGSLYSEPPAGFSSADDIPAFDPQNPWMRKMVECYQALEKSSAGRYPIGTTRFRGVSDLLAALYGGDELIFRMMDEPEDIQAAAKKLAAFFVEASRLQLRHIPPFEEGIGSFYYYMWAPPGTVWYQEDSVALLSPPLYEQFIEPCVRYIVRELKSVIIHQHSVGFVPVQSYMDAGMTALEMHIDRGGPTAQELFPVHCQIQKEKPLLIWGDLSREDFDWLMEKLPPEGLALSVVVQNPEQAEEYWRRFETYYH
ncbi:MAG: hypothetical protein ACOX7F_07855 [Eubacteriales bacterium]|jgi:hypothetical protein